MAATALPIIGALGSVLGGLFGNRSPTTTTNFNNTSNQSGSSTSNSTGYNTPSLTGGQQSLENLLNSTVFNSLLPGNQPDLSGYASNAAQNINQGANANDQLLKQTLAARGLSYSPIAANALTQSNTNRIGQLTQLKNSLPLLSEQLLQNRLQNAVNVFRSNPFGSTFGQSGQNNFQQTGTNSGTQTTTGPSNMLGGLFGGIGQASAIPGLGTALSNLFGGGNSPAYI